MRVQAGCHLPNFRPLGLGALGDSGSARVVRVALGYEVRRFEKKGPKTLSGGVPRSGFLHLWVLWKSRVWRRVWRRVGDLHVRHFIIMRPVRLGPTISTAPHQSAATAGRAEARREGSERRMPSGTHFVR